MKISECFLWKSVCIEKHFVFVKVRVRLKFYIKVNIKVLALAQNYHLLENLPGGGQNCGKNCGKISLITSVKYLIMSLH